MKKLFSNNTARIISTLFVPPSFTILIFTFFAFYLESNFDKTIVVLLVAYILGFIAPIILFLILRKKGKIADQDASVKEERTFPFLIATVFYLIGLIIFIKFEVNTLTIAFWFCYISNTLLTILINKYWKISAHAMGAAGPLAALFSAIGILALLFSPLLIIIGWARIKLKCHTLHQVIAGTILGFTSTYIQIEIIKLLL